MASKWRFPVIEGMRRVLGFATLLFLVAAMPCLLAQDEPDKTPSPTDKKEYKPQPKPEENPFRPLVDEISTNMRKIEELLNTKDTGASTQSLQQNTNNKIEELIKLAEKC